MVNINNHMTENKKFLGLIRNISKRQSSKDSNISPNNTRSNSHVIAWILSPGMPSTFLHQNAINNTNDKNNIEVNKFIFFEIQVNSNNRQDAKNAYIAIAEEEIHNNIFQYDLDTIRFIFEHASENLLGAIISKIETEENNIEFSLNLDKINLIKTKILKNINSPLQVFTEEKNIEKNTNINSFLDSIFKVNSIEYNLNLFRIIVDGIKYIDNDEVFQLCKVLLNFNKRNLSIGFENLDFSLYQKAINKYKFNFWFEGIINFCETEVIKEKFDTSNENLKLEIVKRCRGNKRGFLTLHEKVRNPDEIEVVYFSNIRNKLLAELNHAQKSINVAVAWFTNHELFNVLCEKLKHGVKVELVIINDFINNWEFGLPFQEFIELGGKLYFSKYPNVMHNKFCIIDDRTLLNGSYNWTYFAESRNDENLMLFKCKPLLIKQFKDEFERLKNNIGAETQNITYFNISELGHFEKIGYRKYISDDLCLKAQTFITNKIIFSSSLLTKALEIDDINILAKELQKGIATKVELENDKIIIRETISESKILTLPILEAEENTISFDESIHSSKDLKDEDKQQIMVNPNRENINSIIIKIDQPVQLNKPNNPEIITETHLKTPIHVNSSQTTSLKSETKVSDLVPITPSIHQEEDKKYKYENLQIVFALDYSNSMEKYENGGLELYSSGKIQEIINKIFAICDALTFEESIDLFLFEIKSIRLPKKIIKTNYDDYIEKEITNKFVMNGTNIHCVIEDIHEKYVNELKNEKNVFVILITDGENSTEGSNERVKDYFQKHSGFPIFWQFVGLGENFDFLKELLQIADNVAFFALNDIKSVESDILLKRLTEKFPKWYEESKKNGLIKSISNT